MPKLMSGRQADKLAAGVAGLIGFGFTALVTHDWNAAAAAGGGAGVSLLAVLQVLFEVLMAGGESGDEAPPAPREVAMFPGRTLPAEPAAPSA